MSGALLGGSILASFGGQALSSLGLIPAFIRQGRSIGTIIPDVTIEERFTDRAVVTQHPVASGAVISDHMYILPRQIVMKCGWTNANPIGGIVEGVSGILAGGSIGSGIGTAFGSLTETRAANIYNQLLALQASRKPFTLTTGKRTYGSATSSGSGLLGALQGAVSAVNSFLGPSGGIKASQVVITELSVTNDHRTEYALIIEVHMQEVIIVNVGNVSAPAQGDQAAPQTTQPQSDAGTQQPVPRSGASWLLGSQVANPPTVNNP